MPQIVLEYSDNIGQEIESVVLLREIASIVSAAGGVRVGDFKSRAMRRKDYLVGEGRSMDAFVHLEIGLFAGRSPEIKRRIGEDCLEYLEEYFVPSRDELSLQITVEIREMEKESYFKTVIG